MKTLNIGFLASHRDSNMQTVIEVCASGRLNATPGVPAYVLNLVIQPDPDLLDLAILETLQRHGSDIVLLAGHSSGEIVESGNHGRPARVRSF
jgi:folate-dependent phosphoribosylglycinamide formyltransferase PurN